MGIIARFPVRWQVLSPAEEGSYPILPIDRELVQAGSIYPVDYMCYGIFFQARGDKCLAVICLESHFPQRLIYPHSNLEIQSMFLSQLARSI